MDLWWRLCDGIDERAECTRVEIAEQVVHLETQHAVKAINILW